MSQNNTLTKQNNHAAVDLTSALCAIQVATISAPFPEASRPQDASSRGPSRTHRPRTIRTARCQFAAAAQAETTLRTQPCHQALSTGPVNRSRQQVLQTGPANRSCAPC